MGLLHGDLQRGGKLIIGPHESQINDLLDPRGTNLKIREDPNEGAFVAGLKLYRIKTAEDLKIVISSGERARHYKQTNVHEHSSRSHSLFRVLVENKVAERIEIGEQDEELHLIATTKYSILVSKRGKSGLIGYFLEPD